MEINKLSTEQVALIKKPLPPAAIKQHPTKSYLSTIKAIYVTERLNDVFGVGAWSVKAESLSSTKGQSSKGRDEFTSLVKVVFEVPSYGIYYECIAGSSNDDEGDSAKGGITDGITKICSWMGIGAEVYKGEYNSLSAAQAYVASISTPSALEVFWKENRGSFSGDAAKQFDNFVAKRKNEL